VPIKPSNDSFRFPNTFAFATASSRGHSLTLTHSGGTVRAADLGWSMTLRLTEPVPGLFVRVDLQSGVTLEQSCYASEFTYSAPLEPVPTFGVTVV